MGLVTGAYERSLLVHRVFTDAVGLTSVLIEISGRYVIVFVLRPGLVLTLSPIETNQENSDGLV
jgi:hypothetical protein